jgi:hypothetical protein
MWDTVESIVQDDIPMLLGLDTCRRRAGLVVLLRS